MLDYTTSRGVKIQIQPISLIMHAQIAAGVEADFRKEGRPIDPPKYEVEIAGGAKASYSHDETTLEVPDNPEQTALNKQAWSEHVQALSEMNREIQRLQTMFVMEALIFEMPAGWEERQRRYRVQVPEDPDDKRIHYIMTELFPTPEEVMQVIEKIMRVSAAGILSEEKLAAATASFRGAMASGQDETTDSTDGASK